MKKVFEKCPHYWLPFKDKHCCCFWHGTWKEIWIAQKMLEKSNINPYSSWVKARWEMHAHVCGQIGQPQDTLKIKIKKQSWWKLFTPRRTKIEWSKLTWYVNSLTVQQVRQDCPACRAPFKTSAGIPPNAWVVSKHNPDESCGSKCKRLGT